MRGVPRLRRAISRRPCSSISTFKQPRGADDDFLKLVGLVIIQPLANGKTRQQRRREQAAAGGRADEVKRGRFSRTLRAFGPWSMMMSSLKSSIAG